MMEAGVPLVQAFDIVGRGHENPAMQDLILSIKADVEAAPPWRKRWRSSHFISTTFSVTWCAPVKRLVFLKSSSIKSRPIRRRRNPSKARSKRRSSILPLSSLSPFLSRLDHGFRYTPVPKPLLKLWRRSACIYKGGDRRVGVDAILLVGRSDCGNRCRSALLLYLEALTQIQAKSR